MEDVDSPLPVTRLPIRLTGNVERVIALPFGLWQEANGVAIRRVTHQLDFFTSEQVLNLLDVRYSESPGCGVGGLTMGAGHTR